MNLSISVSTSSSSTNNPIASKILGIRKASSRQIGSSKKPDTRRRNSNPDAASSCQGWQRDAPLDLSTGEPVATDKDLKYLSSIWTRNIPEIRKLQKFLKIRNHFHASPDCVPHTEKVFSIVRQTYGRSPVGDLNDFDLNTAIWGIFVSVALQAAAHLGQDFTENL